MFPGLSLGLGIGMESIVPGLELGSSLIPDISLDTIGAWPGCNVRNCPVVPVPNISLESTPSLGAHGPGRNLGVEWKMNATTLHTSLHKVWPKFKPQSWCWSKSVSISRSWSRSVSRLRSCRKR